jgi:hypothetical protein
MPCAHHGRTKQVFLFNADARYTAGMYHRNYMEELDAVPERKVKRLPYVVAVFLLGALLTWLAVRGMDSPQGEHPSQPAARR